MYTKTQIVREFACENLTESKKEAEFQAVFDHGQSVANRNFVIYYLQREQPHFRVGISVGKKIGHTAVMRNQIKRYIRQTLLELSQN